MDNYPWYIRAALDEWRDCPIELGSIWEEFVLPPYVVTHSQTLVPRATDGAWYVATKHGDMYIGNRLTNQQRCVVNIMYFMFCLSIEQIADDMLQVVASDGCYGEFTIIDIMISDGIATSFAVRTASDCVRSTTDCVLDIRGPIPIILPRVLDMTAHGIPVPVIDRTKPILIHDTIVNPCDGSGILSFGFTVDEGTLHKKTIDGDAALRIDHGVLYYMFDGKIISTQPISGTNGLSIYGCSLNTGDTNISLME